MNAGVACWQVYWWVFRTASKRTALLYIMDQQSYETAPVVLTKFQIFEFVGVRIKYHVAFPKFAISSALGTEELLITYSDFFGKYRKYVSDSVH